MILDHVTYQVPATALFHDDGKRTGQYNEFFCDLLGMKEIEPDEGIEGKGWSVRWFEDVRRFQVHLVEEKRESEIEDAINLGLGHFCAIISRGAYSRALESEWREDIGSLSGRAWLKGPGGIRVEIRPNPLSVPQGAQPDGPGAVPIAVAMMRSQAHRIDDLDPAKLVDNPHLPTDEQMRVVFERCLTIFRARNMQHQDSWKREGWRGCLFNLRRKVERAWDYLFNYDTSATPNKPDVDDLLDSINYAALSVLAVEEDNRDGTAGWWK